VTRSQGQLGDGKPNVKPGDLLPLLIVGQFGQYAWERLEMAAGASALIRPQMRQHRPCVRTASIFGDALPSLVKDDQSLLHKIVGGMPIPADPVRVLPEYGLQPRHERDEIFQVSLFQGGRFSGDVHDVRQFVFLGSGQYLQ